MAAENSPEAGGAPPWLFSFVDLAFLMLIAMVMVAQEHAGAPDLGEMIVPKIGDKATQDMAPGLGRSWQLRVHPLDYEDDVPYQLVLVGADAPGEGEAEEAPARIDREALRERLDQLAAESAARPMLAPHEDSRSQDFLDAAAAIEERWPNRRRAIVSRFTEG